MSVFQANYDPVHVVIYGKIRILTRNPLYIGMESARSVIIWMQL